MGFLRNLVSGWLNTGQPKAAEMAFDLADWNRLGRAKALAVCADLQAIIDRDETAPDDDFVGDERSESLADAVLDQVVALNAAGEWQQARALFDPAHKPFVSHMGDVGLHAG